MNITAIFVIAISTKSFAIVTFSVKTITIITIIAISLPIKAIDIKPAPIEPIAVITLCIKTFNVKTIMVISVSIVTINVIAPSIKTIIIKAVNVISVIDRHKPQPLDNKECLYSFYHVMYRQTNDFLHKKISTVLYIVSMQKRSLFKYQWFDEPVTLTPSMIDALYHNTHGIIDQFIGLCMYLNLDYISSKKRPTVDESYINKTAKKHYRGVQQLLDELDDPLKEQKRQKIVDDANRKLDNLLQETKQADFATTILEKGAEADKNLSLKRKVIRNIRVVKQNCRLRRRSFTYRAGFRRSGSYQSGNETACCQKDYNIHKENPIQKHKAEIPKHGKVHHGIKKSAASTDSWERRFTAIVVFH